MFSFSFLEEGADERVHVKPHDMPTSLVLANDQAAIDGIRKAGAPNL